MLCNIICYIKLISKEANQPEKFNCLEDCKQHKFRRRPAADTLLFVYPAQKKLKTFFIAHMG